MKYAKIVAWLGVIAMVAGLTNAFINGNLGTDGPAILSNPWGVMSMVDLYVGFILFAMWIIFREKNIALMVVLIILLMIFGFLVSSLYIAYNLYKSKGDWLEFFLGYRKDSILAENK